MAKPVCKPINDMAPVEIIKALLDSGITQAEIARQIKVSRNAVNMVVHHRAVSDKIRRAIAAAIKTDIKRIWPSTYLYGEQRKPVTPGVQSSIGRGPHKSKPNIGV